MLSDRVARDGDKELTLLGGHVSSPRENGEPSDGILPFYPHLPPLSKRLDETFAYISAWD